jgi:rare lipoprotein A
LKGWFVMLSRVVRSALVLGSSALGALALALPVAAETGVMSHYSGLGVTASGRSYSAGDSVAAHKTLPLGTIVRVENLRNGNSTTVTIVDRGPYIAGRIIDVSPGVAGTLGFRGQGLAPTRITVLGRGPSTGPYDRGGRSSGTSLAQASSGNDKPVRIASAAGTASKRGVSQRAERVAAWREGS